LFSWPVDFFPLNATCQRNKKKGIIEAEAASGAKLAQPNVWWSPYCSAGLWTSFPLMPHVKEIRKRESLKLRLLVVPSLLNQMFGGVFIVQLACGLLSP
jgi:hypothetical protein